MSTGNMTKRTHDLACASSQLAKLHNSLDAEGKERLDDALKLAERTTQEKCAEMVCGFCGAAKLGRARKAERDRSGRWIHWDKGEYFHCSAGPIHAAIRNIV